MYAIKLIHKTYLRRLRMNFRLATLGYAILNLRVLQYYHIADSVLLFEDWN